MEVGNIVYLGDNMAWHVRKPFIDWRGHLEKADYNGYAKISEIQGDLVTVLGLYGEPTGRGYIAHPVRYKVTEDKWECLSQTETPANWDYKTNLKLMTDPIIYSKGYPNG